MMNAQTADHPVCQCHPKFRPNEIRADNMRYLAMSIEDALLKQGSSGVSLPKKLAITLTHALWDFADRLDLDAE